MRRPLSALLALALTIAPAAHADNVGPVKARRHVGRFGGGDAKSRPRDSIHGHCTVLEGGGNPISSSCVNLMLKLTDRDAGVELQTRTDSDGAFAFGVDQDHWYRILPASKAYELDSPTRLLKGGDSVEVRLKQL